MRKSNIVCKYVITNSEMLLFCLIPNVKIANVANTYFITR